ncbi:MAG TPA: MTH1187 family thiamine-binding protein [Acidobacteriota bacterium]|nr:MTH1187 family thiamine-binding protein [Acidobacteriota bacterium]
MKVIIDLSIVPLGVGLSLSQYIAACQEVLKEAGLKTHMHASGTNIEGEWDEVMDAVKQCFEKVHSMGAPRVTASMRLGTRTDKDTSMDYKVDSVREKTDA